MIDHNRENHLSYSVRTCMGERPGWAFTTREIKYSNVTVPADTRVYVASFMNAGFRGIEAWFNYEGTHVGVSAGALMPASVRLAVR